MSPISTVMNSQNTNVLNPNASIFCPSKHTNNIETLNKFPRNINLVYSNLQGMLQGCHFDQFSNELGRNKNVQFIAITETWLRNGVNSNKSINIPSFKVLRSDRHSSGFDKNRGGGVALYVKQNIKTKVILRSFDGESKIENAEFIFVECLLNGGIFAIAVVYRIDSCIKEHTMGLFKLLIEFSSKYNDIIIVGDLNITCMH